MKTVAELLADAGYAYRASPMVGRREVFKVSTGEVVGQFTALDALNFLEAQ